MSILSDSEIRHLCVLPENATYFDQAQYDARIEVQDRSGWPLTARAANELRATIRRWCTREHVSEENTSFKPMISPYHDDQVREHVRMITKPMSDGKGGIVIQEIPRQRFKVLSHGQSPYGYDVRLSEEVKIFSNLASTIVDPKNFDERCLMDAVVRSDETGDFVVLPPNSYMLGRTIEKLCLPNNITMLLVAKSTIARCGIQVNTTVAHAGFGSKEPADLVLEIANSTTLPVKIYVGEGIGTCLFFKGAYPAGKPYDGLYQNQQGVTLPTV